MTTRALRCSSGRAAVAVASVLILLAASAGGIDGQDAVVTAVVDGDTVRVDLGGRSTLIRLLGVDTPEVGDRHDRSAPPQPFACDASDFTRRTLLGQHVRLAFEPNDRLDKYGRTLAYLFLADGTFFNRELVRRGFARAYTRFPFRYRDQFVADEATARQERRGLWAPAAAAPRGAVIGNRRSHVYHVPGQAHYGDVGGCNRVYFDSEAAARAAGFVPAWR
jgi:micrococcal nuclease